MAELFSLSGLLTLAMLVLLQAVLGFDNLLYISIESKRVAEDKQSMVRKVGIGLAVLFRIALLFLIVNVIKLLEEPFFQMHNDIFDAKVSGHSLIVLFGGMFILWTAVKEIYHMLSADDVHESDKQGPASVSKTIGLIVLMNAIFSFDSILSALALSENLWIMTTAIIISGILMILLADKVAEFLNKNRMYEVLGLFVLFIVGIMLVSEGGHLAHVRLFTYEVHAMTKTTFYFVLTVLILVDVVQGRYKKRLMAKKSAARTKQ